MSGTPMSNNDERHPMSNNDEATTMSGTDPGYNDEQQPDEQQR